MQSQLVPFVKPRTGPIDQVLQHNKKKKHEMLRETPMKEIPRRRKPVLQWQGHRALELQAELEGQGRQKLDNQ